jgi:hypothetical protein
MLRDNACITLHQEQHLIMVMKFMDFKLKGSPENGSSTNALFCGHYQASLVDTTKAILTLEED